MQQTKQCARCDEVKTLGEFSRRKGRKDGLDSWCKECSRETSREYYHKNREERLRKQREWHQANRFKVALIDARSCAERKGHSPCIATEEEIEAAFTGRCGICDVPEVKCNHKLGMDHCHETGEFRGWLCRECNKALGLFRDSEEMLIDALHYLMNSTPKE